MMAARRLNRQQTGYVLAGSMGLSIAMAFAFFVFAMPSAMFESIVMATGLPSLIAAAQPPLGDTARLAVAGAAGLLAGGATAALFLLADRREESRRERAKPPFSVASDFDLFEAAPAPARAPEHRPAPPPVFELAQEYVMPVEQAEQVVEAPRSAPAPVADQPESGPIFVDFRAFRETPGADVEKAVNASAPQMMPSPKAEAAAAKDVTPTSLKAQPSAPEGDDSIAALMQRLEAGLDRRVEQGKQTAAPPAIPANPSGLRSTLEELRKMAVRR